MGLEPGAAVALDVDQIPGRQLAVLGGRPRLRAVHRPHPVLAQRGDPSDPVRECARRGLRARVQPSQQCFEGHQPFPEQNHVRARAQIGLRSIARVSAGGDDARARAVSAGDHLASRAAHPAETHLAQEVEVVLVQQHELRLHRPQLPLKIANAIGQHRVEQCHLVPRPTQHRGNLERGKRRVRLGTLELLLVEAQKVGVSNQDRKHGLPVLRLARRRTSG